MEVAPAGPSLQGSGVDGASAPVQLIKAGQPHIKCYCPGECLEPPPQFLQRCRGLAAGIWVDKLRVDAILLLNDEPKYFSMIEIRRGQDVHMRSRTNARLINDNGIIAIECLKSF